MKTLVKSRQKVVEIADKAILRFADSEKVSYKNYGHWADHIEGYKQHTLLLIRINQGHCEKILESFKLKVIEITAFAMKGD